MPESPLASRIPAGHPLRRLFREIVERRFSHPGGSPRREVSGYVAAMLTEFTHVDALYRIRNAAGRQLEQVGDMLVESNPLLASGSFDHEREVRRHVGDFTLFFTGLFPEWLASHARRRRHGIDAFVDYVRAGRESYAIVSEYEAFENRPTATLFRELAEGFERWVLGLNLVKQDLERLQQSWYFRLEATLLDPTS